MLLDNIFNKIKRYRVELDIHSLTKEFLIVTIGQIVSVIGSLVAIKVLTNYLPPIEYGELALGLTISGFFSQIIFGPLTQSIYRFWSSAVEKNSTKELFSGILFLQLISSVIVVVITVMLFTLLSVRHSPEKWTGLLIASFFYVIIMASSSTIDFIQQAARRRVIVAWHQVLGQWLKPLIIILLFVFLPKSSITAFWGHVLVVIVVLISQIFFFIRTYSIKKPWQIKAFSYTWVRTLFNYAWPFCIWGIFTWGQQSFDRWSLQIFDHTRDVGLYSALFQIGYSPIIILSTIIMLFLSPHVYRIVGDGKDESRLKLATKINVGVAAIFLLFISLLSILFIFINNPVMTALSSKAYSGVSGYLPFLMLSGGLFSAGQILSISLLSRRETKSLLLPKVATAILGMIFYFWGAREFGIKGVIFGNISFSAMYLIWISAIILINGKRKQKSF